MKRIITKQKGNVKTKINLSPQSKLFIKLISFNKTQLDEYISEQLENNPCIEEKSFNRSKRNEVMEYFDSSKHEEKKLDLKNYLSQQLITLNIKKIKKELIYYLILLLDENGFLDLEYDEIIELFKNKLDKNLTRIEIDELIIFCREKFEPSGIFVKDIKESLIVQLELNNSKEIEIKKNIIFNDLNLLNKKENKFLIKKYKCTEFFINNFIKELSGLDPRPGLTINNNSEVEYNTDYEAFVFFENKKLIYQSNKNYREIKISQYYSSLMKNKESLSNEVLNFLDSRINEAQTILNTIKERNQMCEKAIKLICNTQKDYILKGEKYLKPLKLADIATELGIHESTVSRITSNKYILTKNGFINLKEFFSNKVDSNKNFSSVSIRSIIKELIQNEDKRTPLSDQDILDILKRKGINIARRTIAKYRNILKIPTSSNRRKKR